MEFRMKNFNKYNKGPLVPRLYSFLKNTVIMNVSTTMGMSVRWQWGLCVVGPEVSASLKLLILLILVLHRSKTLFWTTLATSFTKRFHLQSHFSTYLSSSP